MAEEGTTETPEGEGAGTTGAETTTTETTTTETTANVTAAAGSESWTAGFEDADLRSWVEGEKLSGPEPLAKSYRDLQKLTGGPLDKLVRLPDEPTAENMRSVFEQLGAGKTAEDYKLPVPEGDDGEFAKIAAGWMHEAAITTKQAEMLAEKWNEHIGGMATAQTEQATIEFDNELNELKREWGGNYEANAALVDTAAEKFGMTQDQLDALKKTMGPKDSMNFLLNIGSRIGTEDMQGTLGMSNGNQGSGFGGSPAQAKEQIAALRRDPAFTQAYTSGDADARAKMQRLHQIAYPD